MNRSKYCCQKSTHDLSAFLHPSALDGPILWARDYREMMMVIMLIAITKTPGRNEKITTGKQIVLWHKSLSPPPETIS